MGLQGAWDERWAVLADGLRGLRPDVVSFQEAIVGDGYDHIADLLGPGYHVAHQAIGLVGDGNHGASIASRWPLGDVREADLHLTLRTGDYPCGTLAAEVLVPEPVGSLLFVAHGPSHQLGYEFQRERQSLAAARLVEGLVGRLGTRHVVVAGDFNADPDADSVAFWRGRGIDYVFVRCDDSLHGPTLDVRACTLASDRFVGGEGAGDHFGVAAELSVPDVCF